MNFNEHWNLVGKHAFLSPSQYHWVNYSLDKLEERFFNSKAAERGTELHEYAAMAIKLNRKQPKNQDTVNMFVNDAIGYSMTPEQPLYYSDNCFGTADAISFNKNLLRIHDLKTGVTPASMMQLELYAALFCLEYGKSPESMDIQLRIYQNNAKEESVPEGKEIASLMDQIIEFDAMIEKFKESL
jgi:hypothetical protein